MVTARLFTFDEGQIRSLTTPVTYQRGFDYYHSNSVFGQVAQGNLLWAYCHGSKGEPYMVQVRLMPSGDIWAECTCPYNWGGFCKHITATLLKYLYEPETFRTPGEVAADLKNKSNGELIEIIQSLVEHDPRLLDLVIPATAAHVSPAMPVNLRVMGRHLDVLFGERVAASDIPTLTSSLERVRREAERRERLDQREDAFRIYTLLLTKSLANFANCEDYDGSLASFILRCVAKLTEMAPKVKLTEEDRQDWLRNIYGLFQIVRPEFSNGLSNLLLAASSTTDLTVLEHWARTDWEQCLKGEGPFAEAERQQEITDLLLEIYDRTGHNKRYLELAQRTGHNLAVAGKLLSQGRTEDSLDVAKGFRTPAECHAFSEKLAASGYFRAAVRIAQRGLSMPGYHLELVRWLAGLYEDWGHLREALDMRLKRFYAHPDLESYRETSEVAKRLNRWLEIRVKLFSHLEKGDDKDLLAEVYLWEGQVEKAVNVASNNGLYEAMLLRVAREAEGRYPVDVIPLYQRLMENQIDKVERRAYQQAAAYAEDLHQLYREIGRENDWQEYINEIRQVNRRRPALQEEFAGL